MKKVEFIVRPEKLDEIKLVLAENGVNGMTVTEVEGRGKQPAHAGFYRGQHFTVDLIPKTKIEVVLSDDKVDELIHLIIKVARTGSIGDGKIFVSTIEEVYRIRTGENGDLAL